jgi:hypothetical protein
LLIETDKWVALQYPNFGCVDRDPLAIFEALTRLSPLVLLHQPHNLAAGTVAYSRHASASSTTSARSASC